MYIQKSRQQKGFTVLELGMVLVLVALIMVPMFNRFMDSRDKDLAKAEVDLWTAISSNAQDKYALEPDYTGVTHTTMKGLDIFPATMLSGTSIINKAKGTVTCAAVDVTATKDGLECTSTNYPKTMCNAVAVKLATVMRKVSVGTTVVKAADVGTDMTAMSTACAASGNTLKFVIPK